MSDLVALVTAQQARTLDADLPPLTAALERLGLRPEVVVWDDPTVDWHRYARVVVRSTWDYPARRGSFLAWAGRIGGGRLYNRLPVLRWNTDKRYMVDLAAAGVPIVATDWCMPGAQPRLPRRAFVIKPSVGGGSVGARRFAADETADAARHVAQLHAAGHLAMIQPYLAGIDAVGETALLFFAGVYSHAIRKAAILVDGMTMAGGGLYATERITPTTPTADEMALAEAALAAVPGRESLLYARVDVIPGDDGRPRLLELELCEPSVFLAHGPGAAERMAAAIAALR
jgi:hypothetical protein